MAEKQYTSYRLLGSSGLRVSPLCLGAMGFGTPYQNAFGLGTNDINSEKILQRYLELGGNFIDTASNYQDGQSETIIGNFFEKHKDQWPRESYVLATKFSIANEIFNVQNPNATGNLKKNLVRSLEQSLKRLKVDYIDILYVHFWDFTVKPEDVMKSLEDVAIRSGKVLHLAVSDTPAYIVSRCNTIAEHKGWTPFVAYQGKYSLLERSMEQEIIPCTRMLDMGLVPWGVLASGKLTGRNLRDNSRVEGAVGESQRTKNDQMTESDFDVQDVVIAVAKELGVTPSQVANRFALQINKQTSVLVGPRTTEQLDDLFKSLDFELNEEQMNKLREVSKNRPEVIFPTNFVGNGYDNGKYEPSKILFGFNPVRNYAFDV